MGQSKSYLRILINRQGGAKFTGARGTGGEEVKITVAILLGIKKLFY